MSHAKLELDSNNEVEIALKVLELGKSYEIPTYLYDLRYIHLQIRCLLRQNNLSQIQWILQSSIDQIHSFIQLYFSSTSLSSSSSQHTDSHDSNGVTNSGLTSAASTSNPVLTTLPPNFQIVEGLKIQYYLWEELYYVENTIGLSDIKRMKWILAQKASAQSEYENYLLASSKKSLTSNDLTEKYRGVGIFEYPYELCSRYELLFGNNDLFGTRADNYFRQRCNGKLLLEELIRLDLDKQFLMQSSSNGFHSSFSIKKKNGNEMMSETMGIPVPIRELLVHIPTYTGPLPDIETCIKNLRSMVLPPRPVDSELSHVSSSNGDVGTISILSGGNKRPREEAIGRDWMKAMNGLEEADDEEATDKILPKTNLESTIRSDDVFRQRQRARLLL